MERKVGLLPKGLARRLGEGKFLFFWGQVLERFSKVDSVGNTCIYWSFKVELHYMINV